MLESYRVGAVLELRDEASPALRALFESAQRLEKMFSQVQTAVGGINRVALGDFTSKLQGISEKLTGIKANAEGLGAAVTRSLQGADQAFVESGRGIVGFTAKFDAIPEASRLAIEGVTRNLGTADAALATSTRAANDLAGALREAGAASRDIPRLPRSGGGGFGGGGSGGGGAHPRPGSSGGHGRIQTEHGGRPNSSGPHGAFVDAGLFGTIGVHEVVEAVETTLHRGMEMAVVQQQMLQGGMSQQDIDRATASAWKIARADGLDVTKVMDDIKELRLPFGSTEHALEFIDPLEKMRIVLNSVQAGTGTSAADAVYKMARAGELKGLQNPEDFLSYFEGMTKAISASGGKVTPNDFAQATKYGKLASFGLSEDFYTRSLPTMIQTMGPTTAGQSLQSLFSTLSGSISQKAFYKIQDLGLISDPSKIVQTKTGIQLNPGAIEGYDEFVKNPLAWAKDHLVGKLEAKFGSIDDPNNKEAILGALQGMFGNRNSAAAVAELALRSKSFDKDANLIDQARGLGGAADLLKNDPTTAMNNFSAAWSNLMTALGLSSVATATGILNTTAGALNRLGEAAQAHPEIAKSIEGALAGLAVGLGALAVVGLAAFAPGGLIVVGLTTLASALTGFAAVNWDKVQQAGAHLTPTIDAIDKWNVELRDRIFSSISTLGTAIGDAFASMVDGVLAKLRAIPGIGRLFDAGAGDFKVPGAYDREAHARARLSDEAAKTFTDGLLPGANPFFSPMAYRTENTFGGSANDNGMVDMLALGVCKGLVMYASGGGAAAAAGSVSGIIDASYESGDGGTGGGGSGGGGFANLRYGRTSSGGYRLSPHDVGGGMTAVSKSLTPESRALLDTLASGEAPDYNVMNGGGRFSDYSHHPGGRAAGRYQFLPSTWARVSAALGLHDFSPESQDKGAWWLAQNDYRSRTGRDLDEDLKSNDPARIATIGRALHSTWVSLNGSFGGKYARYLGRQSSGIAAGVGGGASAPGQVRGDLTIAGETFRYGSGGAGGSSSVPFGDYPINPDSGNPWGRAHDAMDVNGNGSIWDKSLGRMRTGIEMHAAHTAEMVTHGCLGFLKDEYPRLKARVREMIAKTGHAYLHVGPGGASITPDRTVPVAGPPPQARTVTPGRPAGRQNAPMIQARLEVPVHLDGQKIAHHVVHRMVAGLEHPTSVGGPDTYGNHHGPETALNDAA